MSPLGNDSGLVLPAVALQRLLESSQALPCSHDLTNIPLSVPGQRARHPRRQQPSMCPPAASADGRNTGERVYHNGRLSRITVVYPCARKKVRFVGDARHLLCRGLVLFVTITAVCDLSRELRRQYRFMTCMTA